MSKLKHPSKRVDRARITRFSVEKLERRQLLSLTVTPYNPSSSLQPLIDALVVPSTGITVDAGTSTYVGQNGQGGTFSGLSATSGSNTLGIPDGTILTSGLANNAFPASNDNHVWGSSGDSNLTTVTGMTTHDANAIILQFTTTPGTNSISFDFIYGSYDGTLDGFGAFLDGTSITANGSGHAISRDPSFVTNSSYTSDIGYDGITVRLRTVAPLDPNITTHTLKLVAADCGDSSVDSGVFLADLRGSTSIIASASTSAVQANGTFQFDQSTQSTDTTSSNVSITVDRVGGTLGATTVDYATSNGTASAGSDYTNSHGTLSFADGQTTATISVPLLDNAAGLASSDFGLTLTNPTGGAVLGTPQSTTITILNNLSVVQLATATYNATTDDSHVLLTVVRAGDLSQSASIHYATTDGTAIGGTDYTSAEGTVSFSASQASETIDIPLLDNAGAASSTQFEVTLSSPAGNGVLGDQTDSTITITNSHSLVQFTALDYSTSEADGGVTITVSRVGNLASAGSIAYLTVDGTAIQGVNYVATTGVLTFDSQQNSAMFFVPITQDMTIDPTIDFGVSLHSPTGNLGIGSQHSASVSIADFTPPPTVSSVTVTPAASGSARSAATASTLQMTFNQPLAAAPTAADIHLYRRSGDRPNGKGSSHRLPITISSFDAATQTLTLKPRRPLHANRFYQLVASGSAAQSPNGSMLDGAGTGVAGSSYSYYFGSGRELNYVDRDGNRVALILHGPGTIHLVRGSDGEGENVSLTGTTAATVLTGWVHPTHMGGSGETTLASIAGLGAATNNLPATMFVIE